MKCLCCEGNCNCEYGCYHVHNDSEENTKEFWTKPPHKQKGESTEKMKQQKTDYKAIAIFEMAKQDYKKSEEWVAGLREHYGVDSEGEGIIWENVIDKYDYDDLKKDMEKFKKENVNKK